MTPELLKVRALPTPRWTFAVAAAVMVLTLVIAGIAGSGTGDDAVDIGGFLPLAVGSIVLGAWIVGVEYGQHTMRRVLSADPRRLRLVGAKLVVLTLLVAALATTLYGLAAIVFPLISGDNPTTVGDILRNGVAAFVASLIYAYISAAIALLTRSMAGGVTLALVFAFVIAPALTAIPDVGDYTLSQVTGDIADAIAGNEGDHHLGRAIPAVILWVGAVTGLGLARFVKSDV